MVMKTGDSTVSRPGTAEDLIMYTGLGSEIVTMHLYHSKASEVGEWQFTAQNS